MARSHRLRVATSLILGLLLVGLGVGAGIHFKPRLQLRWRVDALFSEPDERLPILANELQQLMQDEPFIYDEVFKILRERLRHGAPRARQVAGWTIARAYGLRSIQPYEGYLTPADCALIRLVAPRGAKDVGPHAQGLRMADDTDRIEAAELEGEGAAEIAATLLRELRESASPILRWRVVRTLGFLAARDPGLLEELAAHLEREDDPRVVQLLLRTLGGFDLDPPRRQIAAFPEQPLKRALGAPERYLRLAAARARGQDSLDAEQGVRLLADVRAALASPPDAAESPTQPAAWAEVDALFFFASLPPDEAGLASLLAEEWLQAADALEPRRAALRLAFRRLGSGWNDALEALLDRPRPQHFPDEIRANFVGPRWCEDDQQLCPGELPWLVLLNNDPARAFGWLARPTRRSPANPDGRRAWCWIAVDDAGRKRAPRRLPLLRFAGQRPRAFASIFLRSWPTALGSTPPPPAELHWLRTTSQIAIDLCFADGQADAVSALAAFAEAETPPALAGEQQAASLGADLLRRELPRRLRALSSTVRARLLPLLGDGAAPPAQRALVCLSALREKAPADAVRLALRDLAAAGPATSPEDELLVLWAFARARRLNVERGAMEAALRARLPRLFAESEWPYEGSETDRELALAMLGTLSPDARREGENELLGRRVGLEVVPLDLHWGSFDALAAELGASLPEGFEEEPLEVDGVGAEDGAMNPLALAFSLRSLSKQELGPLELRLRLWGVARHLAANPPTDDERAAGWLIALEALRGALAAQGPPLGLPAPGKPTAGEVEDARALFERARAQR